MNQRDDERRGTNGRDDGATFEPARVRRGGGRPIAAAVVALAVGGLAVAGALGWLGRPSTAGASLAPGGPTPATTRAPRVDGQAPASATPRPSLSLALSPQVSSTEGAVRIVAQRHAESTFLHGDVFVPSVTWVFVSIRDSSGRVAGFASVSVPGAAGPTESAAPALRFDVEIAVPDSFDGDSIFVQANAYDASGRLAQSTGFEILADGTPGEGATLAAGTSPPPPR